MASKMAPVLGLGDSFIPGASEKERSMFQGTWIAIKNLQLTGSSSELVLLDRPDDSRPHAFSVSHPSSGIVDPSVYMDLSMRSSDLSQAMYKDRS